MEAFEVLPRWSEGLGSACGVRWRGRPLWPVAEGRNGLWLELAMVVFRWSWLLLRWPERRRVLEPFDVGMG